MALKTALMIERMYGTVEDRGSYLALRTPSVPDYWYGNCLAMPSAPREGDYKTWMRLFEDALPGQTHRVFLIDAPDGDRGATAAFLDAGFEINVMDVLCARELREPEGLTAAFSFRPLAADADWKAVVRNSYEAGEDRPGFTLEFVERKFAAVRRAIEAGRGLWWGAWDGGKLVADMGLFWEESLVRFQDVETHPDYRRRGICRSLLLHACARAKEALGSPLFVIVPADQTVRRVYESVGFAYREKTVDFLRTPR